MKIKLSRALRALAILGLFACMLSLPIFNYIKVLANINLTCKVMAIIVTFILMMINYKSVHFSKLTSSLSIYCFVLIIATVICKANISGCLSTVLSILFVGIMFDYFSTNITQMIACLMLLCELITYANLLSIIMHPEGLYSDGWYWQNWIMGFKNKFSVYILVAFAVAFIYKNIGGSCYRVYSLYLAGIVSSIMADSTTQVLGYMILLLSFFVVEHTRFKVYPYVLAMISILITVVLVVVGVGTPWVAYITNFLGRDSSFSLRTVIWDRVIELIKQSPIYGYGILKNEIVASQLGYIWSVHAHNLVLNILYQGGVLALVTYLLFTNTYLKKLNDNKNSLIAKGISCVVFVYFLMALMESMGGTGFTWIIFYFAFYIDKIIDCEQFIKENRPKKIRRN